MLEEVSWPLALACFGTYAIYYHDQAGDLRWVTPRLFEHGYSVLPLAPCYLMAKCAVDAALHRGEMRL